MSSSRRLALASGWMILATGVINLSMVLFHREMSKRLGPGYADLAALIGVLNLTGVIVSGAATTLTRSFASAAALGGPHAARRALAERAGLIAGAAGLMALLLLAFGSWIGHYLNLPSMQLYHWVVLLAVLGFLMAVMRAYVQGLHAFWIFGAGMMLEGAGRVLFSAYFAGAGYGVQGALWGSLIAVSLAIAACVPALFVEHVEGTEAADAPRDRWGLLRDTTAMGLFSLLCFLDVFVVKHDFNEADAGLYTRVALAGKSFLYLASAINLVALPAFSAALAKGEDARRLLLKFLAAMLALELIGLAVLMAQTDLAIKVLLGNDEFLVLAPQIRVFAAAVIPLALFQLLLSYLLAAKSRGVLLLLAALGLAYGALLHLSHGDSWAIIRALAIIAVTALLSAAALAFRPKPIPS